MNYFYCALAAKVLILGCLIAYGPPWSAVAFFCGAALSLRFVVVKYFILQTQNLTDGAALSGDQDSAEVPPDDQGNWGKGDAG